MEDFPVPIALAIVTGVYFLLIEPWERRRFGKSMCDRAFGHNPASASHSATKQTDPDTQVVPTMSDRAWLALLNNEPDKCPHLLIAGFTGHGKSTFARALLAQRRGEVVILSAKTDDDWGLPFVTYDEDGSTAALQQTAGALVNHLRLRTADDLSLTVVIDDYPILANEKELKEPLTDLLTRAARIGRSKRFRLVVLTQETTARATSTTGQTAVLQNFARVDVANYTYRLSYAGDTYMLRGNMVKLARQRLTLTLWNVPVPAVEDGDFKGDTGTGTDGTDGVPSDADAEYQDVPAKRADTIRRAAKAGLSRHDIAVLVGGNRTKTYAQIKAVLECEERQR